MSRRSISVSEDVYAYLVSMIDDEHVENGDNCAELTKRGSFSARRPTFSAVIGHLIEDRDPTVSIK